MEKCSKKGSKKGDTYVCGTCGLSVIVDEECGCVDMCDIVCCSEPMEKKEKKK